MAIKEARPQGLSKENIKKLITAIDGMIEELDELSTDRFADLEMGLDDIGIHDNPYIQRIFNNASDHQLKMIYELNHLKKTLKVFLK